MAYLTLLVLLALTLYVAHCIYRVVPLPEGWKRAIAIIFCLPLACFVLLRTRYHSYLPMELAASIYVIGNSWLIFFLYVLLMFVLLKLLQLCKVLPKGFLKDNWTATAIVFVTVIALLIYGGIHYNHKYREEIDITSPKIEKPLKVVLASDLHIGYHNRRPELARWVDIINAEQPDLVLFAGDIVDRSLRALQDDDDAAEFRRIKAPVYACLGNHEYYADADSSAAFYSEAGINLLKNEWTEVCGIVVIGRDDNYNFASRKPLGRFTSDIDSSKFTLLLDHQPEDLDEAMECGIDFQFSGHTHNGQIWPATIVTSLEYENSYGYCEKEGTRYYVSSGLGIWGGKFRIGTRSEYVVLNLRPE